MGEKEIFIGVVCVQNWKTEQNIKWCGLLWKVAVAMCNFSQCRRCHITVILLSPFQASLVAQMVKNLPAIQETKVWSLGWEDPLKEHIATHSSILAWRIPMDRKAWRVTVHGVAESGMTAYKHTWPIGRFRTSWNVWRNGWGNIHLNG